MPPLVDFGQSKDINSHEAITPHKSFQRWPYSLIAVVSHLQNNLEYDMQHRPGLCL
jgi:hypothetical protein